MRNAQQALLLTAGAQLPLQTPEGLSILLRRKRAVRPRKGTTIVTLQIVSQHVIRLSGDFELESTRRGNQFTCSGRVGFPLEVRPYRKSRRFEIKLGLVGSHAFEEQGEIPLDKTGLTVIDCNERSLFAITFERITQEGVTYCINT